MRFLAARRDATLNEIYRNAALSLPDGMPIVWFSKLLGKSGIEGCVERISCGRSRQCRLGWVSAIFMLAAPLERPQRSAQG